MRQQPTPSHCTPRPLQSRKATPTALQMLARMLAPLHGVIEDPATGSAAAALTGFLAHLSEMQDGTIPLTIAQGLEMGRPSLIHGAADKVAGQVQAVRVGGPSVAVMEGFLTV